MADQRRAHIPFHPAPKIPSASIAFRAGAGADRQTTVQRERPRVNVRTVGGSRSGLHGQAWVGGPFAEGVVVDGDVVVAEEMQDEGVAGCGDAAAAVRDEALA